jgi:hypothetical protein
MWPRRCAHLRLTWWWDVRDLDTSGRRVIGLAGCGRRDAGDLAAGMDMPTMVTATVIPDMAGAATADGAAVTAMVVDGVMAERVTAAGIIE